MESEWKLLCCSIWGIIFGYYVTELGLTDLGSMSHERQAATLTCCSVDGSRCRENPIHVPEREAVSFSANVVRIFVLLLGDKGNWALGSLL